jgi:hypothetical protein
MFESRRVIQQLGMFVFFFSRENWIGYNSLLRVVWDPVA